MSRLFLMIGSGLMAVGVAAGAFGAHGLRGYFESYPRFATTYETAVRYHLYHSLALIITAWVVDKWSGGLSTLPGYLFIVGITLFSGSLYLLTFTRQSWLGAIAPVGGLAFIAGWISLLLAVWRN